MKLSASIIFQALSEYFEVVCTGHMREALTLDHPVFYDGYSDYKNDRVYLGRPGELPSPGDGVSCLLICVGGNPSVHWTSRTSCLFSIPMEVDILTVFNTLQETFRRFDMWNTEMLSILEGDADYEKMLHSTSALLNRRLTLTDRELKAVATAIPSGAVPIEMVQMFAEYHKENVLRREPFFFKEGRINVYCINLLIQNEYVGNLAIQADEPPLSEGDRLIFELFAHYISVAVKKSIRRNSGRLSSLRTYLSDILKSYPIQEYALRKMLESDHLNDKSWVCIAVSPSALMQNVPVEYLCTQMENLFKTGYAVPSRPYIALFFPLIYSDENMDTLLSDIKTKLRSTDFSVGISNAFVNIRQAQIYFRQAVSALQIGSEHNPPDRIVEFREIGLEYIMRNIGGELPLNFILPPELTGLRNDKGANADYWHTLKVFLDNEMNTSQSARDLFIHRTTMMKRLEYLEKVVDMGTPEKRLYLRLGIYLYEKLLQA